MEKLIVDKEWGTFKDSLKAPVFGWFTYPAGFSYRAAEYSFKAADLKAGDAVYDPFMGSGTTNLTAKMVGLDSYGVEAHPFVFPIARTKMNWEIEPDAVMKILTAILNEVASDHTSPTRRETIVTEEFPELVVKCYLPDTLYELLLIRNRIREIDDREVRDFFHVGLTSVLREVSIAATGWPYIAPNKVKITSLSKNGSDAFAKRIEKMCEDLVSIKKVAVSTGSTHALFLGDSRNTVDLIPDERIDHIFTSPPYLNNFDYADRTRLEMYFMGEASNWGDICKKVRTRLMTSATTQINRSDSKYRFQEEFIRECPHVHAFLSDAVDRLSALRKTKGGKKSYDLMVVGYFNDIFRILKDNYRVLKNGKKAIYILGDSAPYGVHIPTDELIAQIGLCIGFNDSHVEVLRERGGKWKNNPQRHGVALRETIVTLIK